MIDRDKREIESAIKLAFEENLSIYDATYLALADVLGGQLVTADNKFLTNISQKSRNIILLLEEYNHIDRAE